MKSKKLKGVLYAFLPIIILFVLFFIFHSDVITKSTSSTIYLPERDDGYYIKAYDVDIKVNADGTYSVKEKIDAFFNIPSHGIYRWLPRVQKVTYVDRRGKVKQTMHRNGIFDFESPQYATSDAVDGSIIYYLGSQTKMVLGDASYTLSYTFDPGDDRDTTMDMVYYNIIGTGWNTTINNVTFKITFPTAVENDFKFYTGEYGSIGGADRVTYVQTDSNIVSGSVSSLEYGEAITIFKSFDNGYFKYSNSILLDLFVLGWFVLFLIIALCIYLKYRRKSPIVEVVEFSAPEGVTPAEAGFLNDRNVDGEDLSSLLVYWASKGYVKIDESEKGKTFVVKVSDLPENAKKHEKLLFNDLFDTKEKVDVSKIAAVLEPITGYKCRVAIENEQEDKINYNVDPKLYMMLGFANLAIMRFVLKSIYENVIIGWMAIGYILLGMVSVCGMLYFSRLVRNKNKFGLKKYRLMCLIAMIVVFAPLVVLACVTDLYLDFFFARIYLLLVPIVAMFILPRIEHYTDKGRSIIGKILGLKRYIETAEKSRLEMLVKDNPRIFYDILPYAYVLGVSKVYMEKFKDIPIVAPDWYVGADDSYFDFAVMVSLNNTMESLSRTLTEQAIANTVSKTGSIIEGFSGGGRFGGSSGGGGGGFSGGGSGGGGGGRW